MVEEVGERGIVAQFGEVVEQPVEFVDLVANPIRFAFIELDSVVPDRDFGIPGLFIPNAKSLSLGYQAVYGRLHQGVAAGIPPVAIA